VTTGIGNAKRHQSSWRPRSAAEIEGERAERIARERAWEAHVRNIPVEELDARLAKEAAEAETKAAAREAGQQAERDAAAKWPLRRDAPELDAEPTYAASPTLSELRRRAKNWT